MKTYEVKLEVTVLLEAKSKYEAVKQADFLLSNDPDRLLTYDYKIKEIE